MSMNISFQHFNQEQPALHMPSPAGTSTASLLVGAVMGMMTVVMEPMRITAPHMFQPPACPANSLALTETASQKHGCAMPSMTVAMVLMRDSAVSTEDFGGNSENT